MLKKIAAGASALALSLCLFGCSSPAGTDDLNEADDFTATMDGDVIDTNGEDVDSAPNQEGTTAPDDGAGAVEDNS